MTPRVARAGGVGVLLLPVLVFGILLFGGGQVYQCLGLNGCGDMPVPPSSFYDMSAGGPLIVGAGILAWIVLSVVLLAHVARTSRRDLVRAGVAVIVLACAAAAVGGIVGYGGGPALRPAAEGAAFGGIGGLFVAFCLALAVAAFRLAPASARSPDLG